MSEKPELLPCPFCGCTTIIAATGPRAIRPYFECDWCGAEGPIEEPDEDPPQGWNVRTPAALSDHPAVKALVAEAVAAERERCIEIAVRHWDGEPEDEIAMASEMCVGMTPLSEYEKKVAQMREQRK